MKRNQQSKNRRVSLKPCLMNAALFAAIMLCLLFSGQRLIAQETTLSDKASPFTAVKWEGEKPVVMFENEWYRLVKIDRFTTEEIIGFAKKEYGDKWQKRFSEDLVEVFAGMGYIPQIEVKLTLEKNGQVYQKTGEMSEENRRKVRQYNRDQNEAEAKSSAVTNNPAQTATAAAAGAAAGETAEQRDLAVQMAQWIDTVWDQKPSAGTASLRFLLKKDGAPFAGKVSIQGEFTFRAVSRSTHVQVFNPNSNGRWVYEGIDPGTYDLSIEGQERFQGWKWSKKGVQISAGETPLFEIGLGQ